MNEYPKYLESPPEDAYTYGTLSYNRKSKCWTIKGDPCVTELAKRLFPGCDGRGRGVARFTAHARIIGDLNWLMLRYPLNIKESDQKKWDEALDFIFAHPARPINSGMMNEHFFLNECGTGFDVLALEYANKAKKFGKGLPPYMIGVIRAIFDYKPYDLHVEIGDVHTIENNLATGRVLHAV